MLKTRRNLSVGAIRRIRKEMGEEDDRLSRVFNALGDPRRFKIFKILTEERGICVSEIAKVFGISVPAASQQLRVLEGAGLIRGERMGQNICYQVKDPGPEARSILKMIQS